MNVLEARKSLKDRGQLFREGLLGVFDLAGVEGCLRLAELHHHEQYQSPRILLILKPARICVGRRRWVRLRTMSRNSWLVGTG